MNKITPSLIFISVLFALTIAFAQQQENEQFLITWKSSAYAPAFYKGKVLAVDNGSLTVGFELIKNKQLVDINRQEVQWFLNNQLIDSGRGKQLISFLTKKLNTQEAVIRIVIKNLNGKDMEKIFVIPFAQPEVVIEPQAPNFLIARPFFFSVASLKDLDFIWQANDQQTSGSVETPQILELTIPKESAPITISVFVKNKTNAFERVKTLLTL